MVAAARWARGALPFFFLEVAWSNTRDGWVAAPVRITMSPNVTGNHTASARAEASATWIGQLLTAGRLALESLAGRGVQPASVLSILARLEMARPTRQRIREITSSSKRLRREATTLDAAAAILARHARGLDGQTPMVAIREGERTYSRPLYAWSRQILQWAADMLRRVPSASHRPRDRAMQTAALALQQTILLQTAAAGHRHGSVAEIGQLLAAAWPGGYVDVDGERTKKLLGRARGDEKVRVAARRFLRSENVPANVPATNRNRSKPTHRQPRRKRKTPR